MLPQSFNPQYLRQLELLKIRARRAYLGSRQGGHISIKKGHGIDFSDYRKYELGDDPRHIDWAVYARSDRLYVKRFQEEQELTVMIVLDTTASMTTPPAERKWERACEIALSLAYIALMKQDSVVLSAPGYFTTPGCHGGRAIHYLGDQLMKLSIGQPVDFIVGFRASLSRVRFPGVAIIISDFLFQRSEIRQIINMVRAKNFDVNVIQLLSSMDQEPLTEETTIIAVDSETGEEMELSLDDNVREDYRYLLDEHNQALVQFLGESGVRYTKTTTDEPLTQFVVHNLARTGLLG